MVKPILKKRPHSEKNSIDLDRPWEEQQVPGMAGLMSGYESSGPTRSARDVSFSLASKSPILGLSSTSGLGITTNSRFDHARSHSGASHNSVATTASGGVIDGRPTGFVHPFSLQQTPRTRKSPVLDGREYNDDEHDDGEVGSLPTYHHAHSHSHGRTTSLSQPSLRHPTAASQRAASFGDINPAAPPLRLNTNASTVSSTNTSISTGASTHTHSSTTPPSTSGGRSRRAGPRGGGSISSSLSHSDLHLNLSGSAVDSPSLSTFESHTPHSLRSSLDISFPRLRSRSELDTSTRADQIREARRKFEERERAKAEKHSREMLRKRERRDHKEAKSIERQQAAQMRQNSSDILRPSLSRKTTPTLNVASASATAIALGESEKRRDSGRYSRRLQPSALAAASASAAAAAEYEKLAFKSNKYDHVSGGARPSFGPTVDSVAFRHAQRNSGQSQSAKRKTQGYWNGFVLWLRTRMVRMSKV